MQKKAIGVYLRVSTTDQDTGSQEPDLRVWLRTHGRGRHVAWYRDKFTGRTLRRPGIEKLLADAAAGKVGTILVWRIDRLGRTARELLGLLEDLDVAGVEFVSLRDGVDASTAAGRMFRHMLVGFAQYEREVLSERVRAGIQRAREEGKRWGGKKLGQRHRLTAEKLSAVKKLLDAGVKKAAIARQLGIGRASVYRAQAVLSLTNASR
jgi:DNA invertase Pin-like site-specific DNA recombinase